jgi:maltooligosyltrehalose trehalohydrolase
MPKFSVWAPKPKSIELVIGDKKYPMEKGEKGFYSLDLPGLKLPVDYFYCLDGERLRPDPASKFQPKGVHGPSRLYDTSFPWTDQEWKGIPLIDYIIYELHVGTFTPEGTFEAIIGKLPYLKELGITAIELMPVTEFPGERNWGYDGVHPFAPHHAYGGPFGFKKLINACHDAGFALILDVVYNHLGHEGNYLGEYGDYFNDHYKTPWGQAVNFDGENSDQVRRYVIENALYWQKDFHVDALRLDAVHAIYDFSATHILEEIKRDFKGIIFAESDLNDPRIIMPHERGGYEIDAQWSDDFHHSLFAYLTQIKSGYFADFGDPEQIIKSIREGFVYDGQYSVYRKKKFGRSSASLPGEQFVINLENHDQIGNAYEGRRLGTFLSIEAYKKASELLFFAPNIPLIFMGQEWMATTPFYYFTSYEDQKLAATVNEGRCQNPDLFQQSKLNWAELEKPDHQAMFQFYKDLIAKRKEKKCLSNCRKDLTEVTLNDQKDILILKRKDPSGEEEVLKIYLKGP